MIYLLYALLVGGTVLVSARLGYYVDLLDKKTTMASAFIGGVMLAAVTSLPELMTSISSVILVGKPGLVIGNILGSNVFNLFVMGTIFLLYLPALRKGQITKSHRTTIISGIAVYILLAISYLSGSSLFFYGVSLLSVIILGLYIWSIRTMSEDEDASLEIEDISPLSVRQVVFRFTAYSIVLITLSVALTYASDYLGTVIGLGTTMAGALLLGIATSLPELISCFVLAKIGNFNALTGNIVGSNIFNFGILFVADAVYWNRNLYVYDEQAWLLIILGLIASVGIFGIISIMNRKAKEVRRSAPLALLSGIPLVCYIAFIALSL